MRRTVVVAIVATELGLLLTAAVGLFAPWSVAGDRSRNSFASASAPADLPIDRRTLWHGSKVHATMGAWMPHWSSVDRVDS